MLAGLLEPIPWVKQWHNEPSAEFGDLRPGDDFETFLDGECHTLGLTRDNLRAWRPTEKGKAKKVAAVDARDDETVEAKPPRSKAKKTPASDAAPEGE